MKIAFRLFLLFVLLHCVSSSATAEQLSSLKAAGLSITLEDVGSSQYRLRLNKKASAAALSAEVFAIENPTRLVVDVASYSAKRGQVLKVKSAEVSRLRVGVHPSKLRLVLDSTSKTVPAFLVSKDGSELVVDFSFSASSTEELLSRSAQPEQPELIGGGSVDPLPLPDAGAVEEKEPVVASKPDTASDPFDFLNEIGDEKDKKPDDVKPELPTIKDPVIELSKTKDPEPVKETGGDKKAPKGPEVVNWATLIGSDTKDKKPEIKPKVDPKPRTAPDEAVDEPAPKQTGEPRVKGLTFKRIENGTAAALVFSMNALGKYSLTRSNASAYELRIRGVSLSGKHLELPHFPPDFVSGVEVVVIEQKGPDVVVDIFLEDGVRLRPYRKAGDLWIRVLN